MYPAVELGMLMLPSFRAQDCAIAIAAADLNPAMINPDILRYSGVIPSDWEIAQKPVYTPQVVQITFKNGINLIAEGKQIALAAALDLDEDTLSKTSSIAQQYVRAFPNLKYQGVTFNIRGYLPTDYPPGRYICDTWLASGPWQDDCARAALNFIYKSERAPLQLAVTEAMMKTKEEKMISIVLFNGRYGYAAKGKTTTEKCQHLSSQFLHLQNDVEHYINIVNQKFVKPAVTAQAAITPQPVLSAVS
ncbi:MAG: hypothetical protein AAGF93_01070 [Cyanobacteria bacterium P01_H01_bin.105]